MGARSQGESLPSFHSFFSSQAVELPVGIAGSSQGGPSTSFGTLAEDRMSITALERGLEDSAALPSSRRTALFESDPDLSAIFSKVTSSSRTVS